MAKRESTASLFNNRVCIVHTLAKYHMRIMIYSNMRFERGTLTSQRAKMPNLAHNNALGYRAVLKTVRKKIKCP